MAYIKAIITYIILIILPLSLALILASTSVAHAQTPSPEAVPTLQAEVRALQAEVESVNKNTGLTQNLFGVLGIVASVCAALGAAIGAVVAALGMKTRLEARFNEIVTKEIHALGETFRRADPRQLVVYIPSHEDFQIKREMLTTSGFRGLKPYDSLGQIASRDKLTGILVYVIPASIADIKDQTVRDNAIANALSEVKDLLLRAGTDDKHFGVVIDFKGRAEDPEKILAPHYNFIFANSQATLIPRIFEVARMLALS